MKHWKLTLLAAFLAVSFSLPAGADIRRGDRGEQVIELQQLLMDCGWIFEEPDGSFGGRTEQALRNYQEFAGFEPDGVATDEVMRQLRKDRAALFGVPYVDENENGGSSFPPYCSIVTGSDRLTTELCAEHLETGRKAQEILSADPDNTADASALWQAAVYGQYSSKITNAAAGDKLEAMASYAAFKAQAEKYRAVLTLLMPGEEAEVNREMMHLYEDQAILLCAMEYENESAESQGNPGTGVQGNEGKGGAGS